MINLNKKIPEIHGEENEYEIYNKSYLLKDIYCNFDSKVNDPLTLLMCEKSLIPSELFERMEKLEKSTMILLSDLSKEDEKKLQKYKELIEYIKYICFCFEQKINGKDTSIYFRMLLGLYTELLKKIEKFNVHLESHTDHYYDAYDTDVLKEEGEEYFDACDNNNLDSAKDETTKKPLKSICLSEPDWVLVNNEIDEIGKLSCVLLSNAYIFYTNSLIEECDIKNNEFSFIQEMRDLISKNTLGQFSEEALKDLLDNTKILLMKSSDLNNNHFFKNTWSLFYDDVIKNKNTGNASLVIDLMDLWIKEKSISFKKKLEIKKNINKNNTILRNGVPLHIDNQLYFLKNFSPKQCNLMNLGFFEDDHLKSLSKINKHIKKMKGHHLKLSHMYEKNRDNRIFLGELNIDSEEIDFLETTQGMTIDYMIKSMEEKIQKGDFLVSEKSFLCGMDEICDFETLVNLLDLIQKEYISAKKIGYCDTLNSLMNDIIVCFFKITVEERIESEKLIRYFSKNELSSLEEKIHLTSEALKIFLESCDKGDEEKLRNIIQSVLEIPSSSHQALETSLKNIVKKYNFDLEKARKNLEEGIKEENKIQGGLIYLSKNIVLNYLYYYSTFVSLLPPIYAAQEVQSNIEKTRKHFHLALDPLKENLTKLYGENWHLGIKHRDFNGKMNIEEVIQEMENLNLWSEEKNKFERSKSEKLDSLDNISHHNGEYFKEVLEEIEKTKKQDFSVEQPNTRYISLKTPINQLVEETPDVDITLKDHLPEDLSSRLETINYLFNERNTENIKIFKESILAINQKYDSQKTTNEMQDNIGGQWIESIIRGIEKTSLAMLSWVPNLGAEAAVLNTLNNTDEVNNYMQIYEKIGNSSDISISNMNQTNPTNSTDGMNDYLEEYQKVNNLSETIIDDVDQINKTSADYTQNKDHSKKSSRKTRNVDTLFTETAQKEAHLVEAHKNLDSLISTMIIPRFFSKDNDVKNIKISSHYITINENDFDTYPDLMFLYEKNGKTYIGSTHMGGFSRFILKKARNHIINAFPMMKNTEELIVQDISNAYPTITDFALYQIFSEYLHKFNSIRGEGEQLTKSRIVVVNDFIRSFRENERILGPSQESSEMLFRFINTMYRNINSKKSLRSNNILHLNHNKHSRDNIFLIENTDSIFNTTSINNKKLVKTINLSQEYKEGDMRKWLTYPEIYESRSTMKENIKTRQPDEYYYFQYTGSDIYSKICETEQEIKNIFEEVEKESKIRKEGRNIIKFKTKIPTNKISIDLKNNKFIIKAEMDDNGIIIRNDEDRRIYADPKCTSKASLRVIPCLMEIDPSINNILTYEDYTGGYDILELPLTRHTEYQLTRMGQYYSYSNYPEIENYPSLEKLNRCVHEQKIDINDLFCLVFLDNQNENKFVPVSSPQFFYYTYVSTISSVNAKKEEDGIITHITLEEGTRRVKLRIPEECSRIMERGGHNQYYDLNSSGNQCDYDLVMPSEARVTIGMNPGATMTLRDSNLKTVNTQDAIAFFEEGLTGASKIESIQLSIDPEKKLKKIEVTFSGASSDEFSGISIPNIKNMHEHCDSNPRSYNKKKYHPKKTQTLSIISGLKKDESELDTNNLSQRDILLHIDHTSEMPSLEFLIKNNGEFILQTIGGYEYEAKKDLNATHLINTIKAKYPQIKLHNITPLRSSLFYEKNWIVKDQDNDGIYHQVTAQIPHTLFYYRNRGISDNIKLLHYINHPSNNGTFQEDTELFIYSPYRENSKSGAIIHQRGTNEISIDDIRDLKGEVSIYSDGSNGESLIAIDGFLGACDQMDNCSSLISINSFDGSLEGRKTLIESAIKLSRERQQPVYLPSQNNNIIITTSSGSARLYRIPNRGFRFIGEQLSSDGVGGAGIFIKNIENTKNLEVWVMPSQMIDDLSDIPGRKILEHLIIRNLEIPLEDNTLIIEMNRGKIKVKLDLSSTNPSNKISLVYASPEISRFYGILKSSNTETNKIKIKEALAKLGDSQSRIGIIVFELDKSTKEYLLYNRRSDSCAVFNLAEWHIGNASSIQGYGQDLEVLGVETKLDPADIFSSHSGRTEIVKNLAINIPGSNTIITVYPENNRRSSLNYVFMNMIPEQGAVMLRLSKSTAPRKMMPVIYGTHNFLLLPPEKNQSPTAVFDTEAILKTSSIHIMISSFLDIEDLFQPIFLDKIMNFSSAPEDKPVIEGDVFTFTMFTNFNSSGRTFSKKIKVKIVNYPELMNKNDFITIISDPDKQIKVGRIKRIIRRTQLR